MFKPLDPEVVLRVRKFMTESRLPDGETCASCSNFRVWCMDVLAGQKPFDGDSRFCFFGSADEHFNVDFRNPSEFLQNMHKRAR